MRIDLHTHSVVSDGTDTPTRLVQKALDAGLDVIALTDHDTFDGVAEAQEAGRRLGVRVLSGVEISTKHDGGTVHLLGYGCDPYHRELSEELAKARASRLSRLPSMCERLTDLGVPVSYEEVLKAAKGSPSPGRPHVADVLLKKGFVTTRKEAFTKYLAEGKPAYVERYGIELERAIDLIHDAKGVAVLAHPWGRKGAKVLSAEVIEGLVRDHGLEGLEVEHQDHDQDTRELLFEMGGRLGLVRTGSSDYHGTGKENHDLGCNMTRPAAFQELVQRIRARGGTA